MTMSVKMLNDIAVHAEGLASEAVAMAEALRAVVDDCAAQVAANRSPDNPTGKTDPEWLEDAQKNIVPPEAEPGKKLTIAVRPVSSLGTKGRAIGTTMKT